jgi:hypothetical protein
MNASTMIWMKTTDSGTSTNGRTWTYNQIDMSAPIRKAAEEVSGPLTGWMRLPFKPVTMRGRLVRGHASGCDDFIIDEATTYCDSNGASGSMQIPVPPGATHVTGFRIAGVTRGEVIVRLFRTGWNLAEGRGEQTILLSETFTHAAFLKESNVNSSLDESHALAVSIIAQGETEIWLVAARFRQWSALSE